MQRLRTMLVGSVLASGILLGTRSQGAEVALDAAAAVAEAAPQPSATAEPASPLLERIAVVGASLSSGAGHMHELGVHANFGPFLEAVLTSAARSNAAEEILDLGSFWTFLAPDMWGRLQVDQALHHRPSLVVAVDFLFWYGHGGRRDLASVDTFRKRMARLERGLAQLDRLPCPILVGDLPNIEFALEGHSPLVGGPLIIPPMLPDPEVLAAMNARIRAWAQERPRVTVAPLADFVERVRVEQPLTLGGSEVRAGSFTDLIQRDQLHPRVQGALLLALVTLDALERARDEIKPMHIHWDLTQARKKFEELMAPLQARAKGRADRRHRLLGR